MVIGGRLIRGDGAGTKRQRRDRASRQVLWNMLEGHGDLWRTGRDQVNLFAALVVAVRSYRLGLISLALYHLGG